MIKAPETEPCFRQEKYAFFSWESLESGTSERKRGGYCPAGQARHGLYD